MNATNTYEIYDNLVSGGRKDNAKKQDNKPTKPKTTPKDKKRNEKKKEEKPVAEKKDEKEEKPKTNNKNKAPVIKKDTEEPAADKNDKKEDKPKNENNSKTPETKKKAEEPVADKKDKKKEKSPEPKKKAKEPVTDKNDEKDEKPKAETKQKSEEPLADKKNEKKKSLFKNMVNKVRSPTNQRKNKTTPSPENKKKEPSPLTPDEKKKKPPPEMRTQSTQTEESKQPEPEPEPTRIINVKEVGNSQKSPVLRATVRPHTANKEVQTLTTKVSKRTIATNTDNILAVDKQPKKTVECKSIETSTADLVTSKPALKLVDMGIQTEHQQQHQQQNGHKIEDKIIFVSNNRNNRQSHTWKPQHSTNDIPSTPEGPRFEHNGSQLTYTHPGVQHELLEKIHTLQTQGLMCDVYIRVGSIDFKAHKIVLAASSPYFNELFRNINTVRVDRLILEGLQPQSVAAMLGYFYMAKLIIDAEDVENLLDSAYYFKTTEVVKLCTDYLELQLGLHNCFIFYQIAIRHNIEGLRLKTFRYICWNFKSIMKERRFLEVNGDILLEIVSSKEVKVKSEEEIYESIWEWYNYNKTDRGLYIPRMVMQIHFELMELEYLQVKVKKQLYLESELCRKKVDDALNIIKNKVDSDTRKLSLHRQASDNVYLFSYLPTTCELLDLMTGKCGPMPDLRPPPAMVDRDYHITVKAGKMLYTLSKSTVACFNPSKMNWEYFSKGIQITEAGICCTKNSIFVAGGKPEGKQFYELSLVTKQWTKLPDMEFDRRSPAVAAMGNTKPRIFVAGGFSVSKSCVLDTMEYYVVSDKVWKLVKQPMSVPRLQASMIVNTDKVFIVGGRSEEKTFNTIDIFDRTGQKWIKNSCNLSEGKVEPLLIMFEGKIYCIGGNDCTSIEVLNEADSKRKWNVVGMLTKPKTHARCVVYSPV